MLRKLVVLAITSGLAKKAYDHYKSRNPVAAAEAERSVKDAGRRMVERARARKASPDAS